MYKAIFYKEWLKTRWALLIATAIGLLVVLEIYLNLIQIFEFNDANTVWGYILFQGYLFYSDFQYIPSIIGLIFGISQFLPEIQDKRLKLHLHLPLVENTLLFAFMIIGFITLSVIYIILTVLLGLISLLYFPVELLLTQISIVAPWLLSGYAVYFFIAVTFVELSWIRRILLLLLGYIFFSNLSIVIPYPAYSNSIIVFGLLVILISSIILLSGYRFKRGIN